MFYEKVAKKLKCFADYIRREHAIVLQPNVPVRIHSVNGGYMFSVIWTECGVYQYEDKRWGNTHRKAVRYV